MRPILRPGTHVLDRGTGDLQVGLDPRGALLLPGSAPVRSSLRMLAESAERESHVAPETLQLLEQHDLVMDERALLPLLGSGAARADGAALARAAGPDAPRLRARRRDWRTSVVGFGHPAGARLRADLVGLLRAAGLRRAHDDGPAGGSVVPDAAAHPSTGHREVDAAVLVGVGEPDRELLDGWTRSGTPSLLVRLTEGRAVVGPFVVPGTTACLRCVDAHCTDADPAWPLLVRQYAAATARDRADGAPEPLDPLLATLAIAWAARDLASYVDGRRPSSWSTTLSFAADLSELETRSWLRHPGCGCTWG